MTTPRTDLAALLPSVYLVRDAESGGPLEALLKVIAEQVDIVRDDIEDLYDDWFIETCRDWVVPYIGELIGYQAGAQAVVGGEVGSREWLLRSRMLVPRRDVARSIAHRRHKGTLALLEQLGTDAADWPTRAVEQYTRVLVTQHPNHFRPDRGRLVDLRNRDALDRLDRAFDEVSHLAAPGRIGSHRTRRRPNIPNVALFAWRLQAISHTRAPARNIDRAKNRFTFDILGVRQPLVTRPAPEPDPSHIAGERNVPAFIRRLALDIDTADLYGQGRSLLVYRAATGKADPPELEAIPVDSVVAADLTDWQYRPRRGQVLIDPVLGRIAFHPREALGRGVWVTYHHAAPAAIGGGEYLRPLSPVTEPRRFAVGRDEKHRTIGDAYRAWQKARANPATYDKVRDAVIEITDNEEYVEAERITLHHGDRLEIRAAQGRSPLVRLLDLHANRSDSWEIEGAGADPAVHGAAKKAAVLAANDAKPNAAAPDHGDTGTQDGTAERPAPGRSGTQDGTARGAVGPIGPCGPEPADCDCPPSIHRLAPDDPPELVFDGLTIAGRSVRISGEVGRVHIRHSTLVPGWWLDGECAPESEEEPSLEVDDLCGAVVIQHSILGTILVGRDEVRTEPMPLTIEDSVLDATRPDLAALAAQDGRHAHANLTIRRTTVFGRTRVHRMDLGEDSIFADHLSVRRRQVGCVRFSYVPPKARTPRRHACQPDLALARIQEAVDQGRLPVTARDSELELTRLRIRPRFDSRRYRTPMYARLNELCPPEISAGASDGSEMGVYHDLFQPIREANLRARLDESIPAGSDAAVVFET
jgi:hypothetical protein